MILIIIRFKDKSPLNPSIKFAPLMTNRKQISANIDKKLASIDSVPIYFLSPILFFLKIYIPNKIITNETKTLHVIISFIRKYPKKIPNIGIKYATCV